jgi:putative hydrolase of the HAD superfamily
MTGIVDRIGRVDAVAIFDLDDTLIDTRGVLLPAALERVSRAIGVPVDRLNSRGKRIGEVLAGLAGLEPEALRAAAEAWYSPEVPSLEPLPGAREALEALRGRLRLFLLTRGDPERQQRKVDRSGLRAYFEEVVVRPIEGSGSKRDDIEGLLARCGLPAERCAVIGDDDADELRHARDLGCLAIRVPETPIGAVAESLEAAGLIHRQGS